MLGQHGEHDRPGKRWTFACVALFSFFSSFLLMTYPQELIIVEAMSRSSTTRRCLFSDSCDACCTFEVVAMPNVRQDYSYIDDWRNLWESDLEAIVYNGSTCDPTKVDPKVLDWIKGNCLDKPHFVKVINRNAAYGQPGLLARSSPCIAVPGPFVQEHFRSLQRVTTLENAEGRRWKVSFCAAEKFPLWLQGWKRFARDSALKPNDVVVFELTGNSHFRFTIFDEDGNIRASTQQDARVKREPSYCPQSQQQPFAASSDENMSTKKRVISSDNDTAVEEEPEEEVGPSSNARHGHAMIEQVPAIPFTRRKLRKVVDMLKVEAVNTDTQPDEVVRTPTNSNAPNTQSDCGGSGIDSGQSLQGAKCLFDPLNPFAVTIVSKRRAVTTVERHRAMELAYAHAETVSTSPSCLIVMTDAHVYREFRLVLPDRFVTEAGLPVSSTRVTLVDCIGKAWAVTGRINVKSQVQFCRKPWALFALQHLLEEGDVCVFQFTCNQPRTILVRIFRVVPIPMVGRNLVHDHYEMKRRK